MTSGGFSYRPGGADRPPAPLLVVHWRPHESRHVRPYGLPEQNLVLFLIQIDNANGRYIYQPQGRFSNGGLRYRRGAYREVRKVWIDEQYLHTMEYWYELELTLAIKVSHTLTLQM